MLVLVVVALSFAALLGEFAWRRFYHGQASLLALRGLLLADDY